MRDPQAVEMDVFNEYVSVEQAREDYGVVIDAKTMKVDFEETRNIRKQRNQSK